MLFMINLSVTVFIYWIERIWADAGNDEELLKCGLPKNDAHKACG